jgi:hypothetical protein
MTARLGAGHGGVDDGGQRSLEATHDETVRHEP